MATLKSTLASSYRGRLAPSPTGYLHVGHAQTFWAAWQRAQESGGVLVMRMEDLDSDRCRQVYADAAMEDLRWLGIGWQEGPDCGGPFMPYVQSQRREIYLAAWHTLLRGGYIYPCRCSRKDLETALGAPHERARPSVFDLDDEPVYPGTCRPETFNSEICRDLNGQRLSNLPSEADERSDGSNWRFRVNDGEVVEFEDRNLGPQPFVAGVDFGDFVVWRRDDVPSYQLACVADDAAMGITEVVRGADLVKSTARQILLNRALGYRDPGWFHTSLVTDSNGRRLAKRNDALSIRALRQRGLKPMDILSAELFVEISKYGIT